MERGTVSMRVAFVLRSAEVQPLFRDLCDTHCSLREVVVLFWTTTISCHVSCVLSIHPPPHLLFHSGTKRCKMLPIFVCGVIQHNITILLHPTSRKQACKSERRPLVVPASAASCLCVFYSSLPAWVLQYPQCHKQASIRVRPVGRLFPFECIYPGLLLCFAKHYILYIHFMLANYVTSKPQLCFDLYIRP